MSTPRTIESGASTSLNGRSPSGSWERSWVPVANRVWTRGSLNSGSSRSVRLSTMSSEATARDLEAYQRWCWTQSRRLSPPSRCQISAAGIWTGSVIRLLLLVGDQLEPEELPRTERQQVWEIADLGEMRPAEQLHRVAALVSAEVELDRLGRAGDVVHAQHQIILELT